MQSTSHLADWRLGPSPSTGCPSVRGTDTVCLRGSASYAVKYVPSWLPGAQFKRDGRVWREIQRRARDLPFQKVVENMVSFHDPQHMEYVVTCPY